MAIAQTGRAVVNVGINIGLPRWSLNALSVSQTAGDPPIMTQIAGSQKSFTFPFRPLPIQHEGYGPELSEVERPYNIPILDVKSGKLRRFSFELPLAIIGDSIETPIDDAMERLKEIADDGYPVRFIKMAPSVSSTNWYISDLSFSQDRTTINGPTTRFSAQMSFVEYAPFQPKFVFLQPISYGVPNDKQSKKIITTTPGGPPALSAWGIAVQENRTAGTP
ncbi:MAG: hypothetical protein EBT80_00105 [Chitinophagales bacterium]|nr:hypothetical protein [Chitinophagales bacterium]